MKPTLLAGSLLIFCAPVFAGEFSGEAALGVLTTSGNSETRSINGKLELVYASEAWKNSFGASAISSADDEGSTAERYTVGNKLDYNFSPRDYAFGAVEFEKDLFGGIKQRTSETVGYGRHILTGPRHLLDAEIGGGARQTEEQDTGERYDDFIGRFAGKYQWNLTETSTFLQTLKVESGESNTFTESVSELRLSIIGNLFAGISFTARNNSDVPPDTKKTDTFTAVNLNYNFGKKPG